jgi:nucleoside-diphosphate-sugar epimerase
MTEHMRAIDGFPSAMEARVPAAGATSSAGLDSIELSRMVWAMEARLRSLSDASILITGATGWFGVWLLDTLCAANKLLKLGMQITAVSRHPERFTERFPGFAENPRINWIKTDIRQLEPVSTGFSHVIHGAADTSPGSDREAPLRVFETIVEGTHRAIAAAGTGCKSFLLLSSGAVYGPAKPQCERFIECAPGEGEPPFLKDAYAKGKHAAEGIAANAADVGLPVRIARCFAFVGPHMPFDKHFAIGNFIADSVCGRPIRVKSDGRPLRSYLYMTDLIHALIAILANGNDARPYNVGSDTAVTIEQLAHCVDRVVGGRGVIIEGAVSDPKDRYIPDTTRLNKELGCMPDIELETAIARTAAWYRAQLNKSMPS